MKFVIFSTNVMVELYFSYIINFNHSHVFLLVVIVAVVVLVTVVVIVADDSCWECCLNISILFLSVLYY